MAFTKTWGFTSNPNSKFSLTLPKVEPVSSFALVEDEPTSCSLINNESQVDLGEKLTYNCMTINNVASGLDNMHPSSVKTGVQYQIKLDEQLSVTDSTNPTFREDLPVTAYITIRHPKNGNITASDVDTIVKRLLAACYKQTGESIETRFSDLMKSALRPTVDGLQ